MAERTAAAEGAAVGRIRASGKFQGIDESGGALAAEKVVENAEGEEDGDDVAGRVLIEEDDDEEIDTELEEERAEADAAARDGERLCLTASVEGKGGGIAVGRVAAEGRGVGKEGLEETPGKGGGNDVGAGANIDEAGGTEEG